jgi:hypothetical protein
MHPMHAARVEKGYVNGHQGANSPLFQPTPQGVIATDRGFKPPIVNPYTSIPFGPDAFIDSLSTITRSIYLCSVISYFIRSEVFDPVEASKIRETGILKELSAALQPDQQQVLDYRSLSLDTWLPRAGENPVCGAKTSRDRRKGIKSLQRLFDERQHIFIPHYNTRKNVGYLTQQTTTISSSTIFPVYPTMIPSLWTSLNITMKPENKFPVQWR